MPGKPQPAAVCGIVGTANPVAVDPVALATKAAAKAAENPFVFNEGNT